MYQNARESSALHSAKMKRKPQSKAIIARRRKPRGFGHERRGEILAAAKQLFLKEGFQTVTTRRLAERVGLSQPGLYVYYKSKEEILDAVCRSTFEGLVQRFRAVAAGPKSSADLIRQLVEAYVEFGLEHPDEYQLTFMVGDSAPKFTRRKNFDRPFEEQGIGVQSFLMFRDQVARMIDAGHLKKGDVTLVAQTIWAAAHGLVSLMIARPGYLASKRRALIETTINALLTGLQNTSRRRQINHR